MIINDQIKRVVQYARHMQSIASCHFSKFAVGASLLSNNAILIGGCNIESASYGLTMCAERVAVFNAISSQGYQCQYLALVSETASYPCGACRQIIYEFYPNITLIIATNNEIIAIVTIQELLPNAFGQHDLMSYKKMS